MSAQDTSSERALLQKVESLEVLQAQILRELQLLARQVSELKGPAANSRMPPAAAVPDAPLPILGAPSKGAPDAPVVVIEYADFQCPFCGQFARDTLPAIVKQYVETGKVRLVFKNMPLQEIHPNALMAAEAAQCAGEQGKFWEVHDSLFADQRLDENSLVAKVKATGVDFRRFSECVRGAGATKVREDLTAARGLGFRVTPTFLIGRPAGDGLVKVDQMLTGTKDASVFATTIDAVLNGSTGK